MYWDSLLLKEFQSYLSDDSFELPARGPIQILDLIGSLNGGFKLWTEGSFQNGNEETYPRRYLARV